jgi:hypothetical protein
MLSDQVDLTKSEDELNLIFDRASKAIIEMSEEIEKLKVKFGTGSEFVKRKEFLLNCTVEMQERAASEINDLRKSLKLASVTNMALEAVLMSFDTGVHTDRLLKLLRP